MGDIMALCNCMNCKKIVNIIGELELCSKCDEILFNKIKDYMKNNKGVTIDKMCKEIDISPKIVKAYIKSGRIEEFIKGLKTCQLCGDIIEENEVYCRQCQKRIKFLKEQDKIKSMKFGTTDQGQSLGMHFVNKNNIRR